MTSIAIRFGREGAALVALVSVILLGLIGCAPACETGAVASASPAATPPAPVENPEPPVPTETTITITIDGAPVTAVLQNNAASASLLAQLPLDLSFTDYSGQEKIAGIPTPLALDGMPAGASAEPGTIGYYAPDQAIVLYYNSVGYYNGIIPLGTFDGVAAVRDSPAFVGTVAVA